MERQPADKASETEAIWRQTLTQGHAGYRIGRKLFRLVPGPPRCKVCHNPFGGAGGRVFRVFGMGPSRKNPRVCSLCCEKLPRGGAEVEIAILFADIRGSTALAERLGPTAFAAALNRFYGTATEVLIRHDATIDKLIGDEVMAFFAPGLSGPAFKRSAVEAGQALLRALGYGSAEGPWLPVGVGVDAGIAFVGNVGAEDYVDFTALGDPVNAAARIQAAAQPGEMLVGEAAFASVVELYPGCEPRFLEIRGKEAPICVRPVPLSATA